jgi:hypothetical protein
MGQGGEVLGGEARLIEWPVFHKSAIGERRMTARGLSQTSELLVPSTLSLLCP